MSNDPTAAVRASNAPPPVPTQPPAGSLPGQSPPRRSTPVPPSVPAIPPEPSHDRNRGGSPRQPSCQLRCAAHGPPPSSRSSTPGRDRDRHSGPRPPRRTSAVEVRLRDHHAPVPHVDVPEPSERQVDIRTELRRRSQPRRCSDRWIRYRTRLARQRRRDSHRRTGRHNPAVQVHHPRVLMEIGVVDDVGDRLVHRGRPKRVRRPTSPLDLRPSP